MNTLTNTFIYKGRSMWPCFQEGDLLVLANIEFNQIRVGDCIAYQSANGRKAVHRVVALRSSLVTRGDSLPCVDTERVTPDQITGRVVSFYRFGRQHKVVRGFAGRIAGLFYRYAGRIDPQRQARGGRLARRIRSFSMAILKTAQCHGKPKRLKLDEADEVTVWTMAGRVIGRQGRNSRQWEIAWPWVVLIKIGEDV